MKWEYEIKISVDYYQTCAMVMQKYCIGFVMVKLKDIADITGVSVSTVSRVLSGKGNIGEETKKKVLAAIDEFMFKPGVVTRKFDGVEHNIALVVPSEGEYYRDDPSSSADIRAIQNEISSTRSKLEVITLSESGKETEAFLARLSDGDFDALILSDVYSGSAILEKVRTSSVPYIITNGILPDFEGFCIDFDNAGGMSELANYLFKLGHSKIAVIAGPKSHTVTQNRLGGVFSAMKKHDVEPVELCYSDFNLEAGYIAGKELLQSGVEFTAIIAFSDLIALGAMKAIKEQGLSVPDDVSITGVDNIEFSEFSDPPLTTLQRDVKSLAAILVKYILDLPHIYGSLQSLKMLLKMQIMERSSCKSLRK